MGWKLILWMWPSLILLQHFNGQCLGCLETERAALLQFKHSVNWTYTRPGLTSWVDDKRSDCCVWERVECNLTTGRVIRLLLNYTRGYGYPFNGLMERSWFINASVFLPLEELQHLDLSYNYITGWLENEGFEKLSSLKELKILELNWNQFNCSILTSLSALQSVNQISLGSNHLVIGPSLSQGFQRLSTLKRLQALYLDGNYFGNSILPYLASFTSLKILSLEDNNLKSSTPSKGLEILSGLKGLEILDLSLNDFNSSILLSFGAFTSLKELHLAFNHLDGSLPLGSGIWSGLKKLEVLNLQSTDFNKDLLPSLGELTSLKQLDLSNNSLNGYFPPGLCGLKNLQWLSLNMNNFEGILPTCLGNLTSLRMLALSWNRFRGNIPSSPLSNLTSLEYISLSYNNFETAFPLISVPNHSKLVEVHLDHYSANLEVKIENEDLLPKFQLKLLSLSECSFKKPIDIALKFLYNQYDLRELFLIRANLTGNFPMWLIENNTRLQYLYLEENSLTGYFHLPNYPLPALSGIDISMNNINGHLQENIGEILPNLVYLNLSGNAFGEKIPSTIGDMRQLLGLDLSSNNFSGEVPETLAIGCIALDFLKLSNNSLSGQIFPNSFNLLWLQVLYLDSNHFTGIIPTGISKCSQLVAFDVGKNNLSGTIPTWVGNLTKLITLVMRGNSLEGHITPELCRLVYIELLDLSQNHLSGPLPSCLNLPNLQYLSLQGNRFTGSIPDALLNSTSLVTMNLGDNSFSGSVPNWIGALTNLKVLAVKGNHLSGPLPDQLCRLNQIWIMDLSQNNFSGLIPPCFSSITFGKISNIKHTVGTKYWAQRDPYFLSSFDRKPSILIYGFEFMEQEEVEFITKSMRNFYRGSILNIMSGMDLSCNNLSGEIPHEIGDLSEIHSLNLSHNELSGKIPESLSNLKQVESLDLSYNKLSGRIPSELVGLNFLEVFSVAHNNLSGKTPAWDAQFKTFNETSYEGNPFLCGLPLLKNCTNFARTNPKIASSDHSGDRYGIDVVSFFASFATSYFICLLVVIVVLHINPYWRRKWFDFIDACMDSCLSLVSKML